jgi:hypothetical protein
MGKETAGGEQNGCAAAASRLVGCALSAIPVLIQPDSLALGTTWLFAGATARQARTARPQSHVIVHGEFVRVRSQAQRVVLFLFHVDPVGDEVFVEDIAAQQEGMIGLQRFDCAAQ